MRKHPPEKKLADQVKDTSKKPVKPPEKIDTRILVPTGSTLLNLACSNRPDGGFALGKMVNVIGDSHSGKTLELLTMFAEVARLKFFDPYKLLEDDAEAANEFDVPKMFGERTAKRIIEPPKGISDTTQTFQSNLMGLLKAGKPFIYGLDSFDSISCEEEQKKAEEDNDAHDKGKKVKGTYGAGKPKAASQLFRLICRKLKKTKSLLVIISQTRDNINASSFAKKTRSGGKALKFYACHEMWLAVVDTFTKTVNGRKWPIGHQIRAKVTKNKITGKVRTVEFPVYYDYGIDDVGSCVDFLIAEKVWSKTDEGLVTADELDYGGKRDTLIRHIEDNDLEADVTKLVAATWAEIEESLKLNRKRKYS